MKQSPLIQLCACVTLVLSAFSIASSQQKVGIGTTSPQGKLHIHESAAQPAVIQLTQASGGSAGTDGLQLSTFGNTGSLDLLEFGTLSLGTAGTSRMHILSNGDIGINTTSMIGSADLTIQSTNPTGYGGMYLRSNDATAGKPFYGYSINGGINAYHYFDATDSAWKLYNSGGIRLQVTSIGDLEVSSKIKLQPNGYNSASEIELYDNDGTRTMALRGNDVTSEGAEMIMTNEVGNTTIELDAEWSTQGGGYIALEDDGSIPKIQMYANEATGQGSALKMFNQAGDLTVELDADFAGDGRIITDELEIKGGSDLAEYFSSEHSAIQPGHIVVIDPDNPGKVNPSSMAYDKKVVGVVSGANGVKPGMLMGQKGSIAFGDIPVAIAGRVYVHVDESYGVITPGDFLTTSNTPGHAMKVNDWKKARGSILGKALTYPDEAGFVLMLVHLQ